MDTPSCLNCLHVNPRAETCNRPVPSHWNPATRQRRSRLSVPIASERSGERTLTKRWKCGPRGLYFEPGAHPAAAGSTFADSDGDDGA